MATTMKELRNWLAINSYLPDENLVAVDDGGLTLVIYDERSTQAERLVIAKRPERLCNDYFEIGGVNIDADEEDSNDSH